MNQPTSNRDTQLEKSSSSIPWPDLVEPILPFFEDDSAKAEHSLKLLQFLPAPLTTPIIFELRS